VDLRQPLTPDSVAFIRQALLDHGVVFFHDQELNADQMEAFTANFGKVVPEPMHGPEHQVQVVEGDFGKSKFATSVWHTDDTFFAEPSIGTALRAVKLPPVGGDTCFASMYTAYDALSDPMQRMLDRLTAVHSLGPVFQRMGALVGNRTETHTQKYGFEHVHPVVAVHPITGRKALYVNQGATTRIVELSPAESAHVLAFLFEHVKSPDFCMRWTWKPNDVALWDNRALQHYAVPDYEGERVMQRVVMAGERVHGPGQLKQ
jgi:taurine dioxygenase